MISENYPIIAIGASIASISFIRTLREQGDTRTILLVHGEDRLPYKRTKINKNMVRGFDKDEFKIADEQWYEDNNVTLLFDRVIDVNSAEKIISTKSGKVFSYGKLLIATGAMSVVPKLSGIKTKEIFGVQNAYDVDQVLEACADKERFLIIGGGVEGVETADQLTRKGKQVILASRMKQPLQKLFPEALLNVLVEKMLAKDVKLFSGVSVNAVQKCGDVYKANIQGQELEFDAIIACTGAIPNVELAIKADLKVERGIVVNEYLQTSDNDILAAGDVAQHARGVVTGLWHAAEHQGKLAALNVLGTPEKHTLPPYRLKSEVFGLFMFSGAYELVIPGHHEVIEEKQGDIHRFMYYADGKLLSSVFLNDKERAKIYQQALFEQWDKNKVNKELPLPPKLSFSFAMGS
ncbi:FAD-dependent oxidoreductase [Carboxylicivirga sp. A043]|uniref:NAD(P)/FAD-dependent oxidoreductase n=1 Tax=Carboxylicivirga litoralis TaxID=2816963 RepID=UPI0021CB3C42|nr:FAD-dependent oxidoreductase [Carboxylicivirga sp. A043]MCU4154603.1 FAD-dependent oxidoreductase [Carboxylicivirga sp. A043]